MQTVSHLKIKAKACRLAPRAGPQLEAMQRQWSEEAELGAALRAALLCTPAGQDCGDAQGDPQLQVLPQISASATCHQRRKGHA